MKQILQRLPMKSGAVAVQIIILMVPLIMYASIRES